MTYSNEPFSPEPFVDRDRELDRFKDAVAQVKEGTSDGMQILEFYGLPGMGKTLLLRRQFAICSDKQVPAILVDLADRYYLQTSEPLVLIMEKIVAGLGPDASHQFDVAKSAYAASFEREDADIAAYRNRLNALFIRLIQAYLEEHPLVSIFDGTTDTIAPIREWLLRLMSLLAPCSRLLIVLDGKNTIRNEREWELKGQRLSHRYTGWRLAPFSPEETAKQLAEPWRDLAEDVHGVTIGLPLANVRIKRHFDSGDVDPRAMSQVELKRWLAGTVTDEVINGYILKEGDKQDRDLRPLFYALAVPRFFKPALLQQLLLHFDSEYALDKGAFDFLRLSGLLLASRLVHVDEARRGYALDPTLRRMLAAVRQVENPIGYVQDQHYMFEFYDRMLGKEYPDRETYTHEKLYHQVAFIHAEDEDAPLERVLRPVVEHLRADLEQWFLSDGFSDGAYPDISACLELKRRLEQDRELAELIGVEGVQEIGGEVRRFVRYWLRAERECVVLTLRRRSDECLGYYATLLMPREPISHDMWVELGDEDDLALRNWRELLEAKTAKRDLGGLSAALLPPDVQEALKESAPMPLEIHTDLPWVPWELLHDGKECLCLQRPMGKLVIQDRKPRRGMQELSTSFDGLRVLLIANPEDNLPHAEKEVESIREMLLDKGVEEHNLVFLKDREATLVTVRGHLADPRGWHLIHYAGHATFHPLRPDQSSLRFRDRSLVSAELERLLRGQPLVFLNGCHTGELAEKGFEGLAAACLMSGALGCVGTLWQVADGVAQAFAVKMYQTLLDGEMVGESVRQARAYVKDKFRGIDWAAFVFYGATSRKLFEPREHPCSWSV